ncbi:FKBP-type peptidyl-prolyl cis-trans isomerase [Mucilaginibacter flavidus]|uniref:FKBP-type peptidyl-prolyl cis-trans isomerase n=1 Tax=Mucilaginibacter flavidus TaxID=2949309 RepID=UPI00209241AD|nr:FKBP-type peptidyl-prolyl cis-trans isomerase [Mucilaginibacter flavidus]MCO5950050.1 FKBP-type peptidyl-prolyl cis-trans isomerase [Mucilaginibacter flavidus]
MRQKFFTLLFISAIGLVSCRKDKIELDIKQYDDAQIQAYISSHGITGMQKDTSKQDSSGIYYQLLLPGKVVPPATTLQQLDYPDKVSFVFTLRSVDGQYISADTIQNRMEDYLGHLTSNAMPYGLEMAIRNIVKYKGASARLLIPSHLAYGVSGYGLGSSSNANTKIAGNQCLDYYVHVIDSYKDYDQQLIQSRVSDISTYTKVESAAKPGYFYYYKIQTPGTGTDKIGPNSTITCTYTGELLNGTVFDGSYNGTNIATQPVASYAVSGLSEALQKFAVAGTKIVVIVPSDLAYGNTTAGSIPTNSVLKFSYQVLTVTQ